MASGTNSASQTGMPRFNPGRIRTWVNRLPFFTRIVFLLIVLSWLVSLVLAWVPDWGALTPAQISFANAYQLNTFPVVHRGILHTLIGLALLTPLLERFEAEYGTLNTVAMFVGPLSTFPGLLYILIDYGIFRHNDPILGSNVWIFTLFSLETIKQTRTYPTINISTLRIPLWTVPLAICLFLSVIMPSALTTGYIPNSLLCNLCGCLVGFAFGLGYMKIFLPPERVLRFIEGKLNLLGRLPHYVSVDQKTFGRYGVLPSSSAAGATPSASFASSSPAQFAGFSSLSGFGASRNSSWGAGPAGAFGQGSGGFMGLGVNLGTPAAGSAPPLNTAPAATAHRSRASSALEPESAGGPGMGPGAGGPIGPGDSLSPGAGAGAGVIGPGAEQAEKSSGVTSSLDDNRGPAATGPIARPNSAAPPSATPP